MVQHLPQKQGCTHTCTIIMPYTYFIRIKAFNQYRAITAEVISLILIQLTVKYVGINKVHLHVGQC